MRAFVFVLLLLAAAEPAAARLWKPTLQQQAGDYLTITHNVAGESTVIVWMAPPLVAPPSVKPLLEKYVVLSIAHTRRGPDGLTSWDDIQGVQLSDGNGENLKQVPMDAIPPTLVGLMAASDASVRQNSLGKAKVAWSIWEPGSISACQKGKLVVTYDGEAYSFDTPLPGCPKS